MLCMIYKRLQNRDIMEGFSRRGGVLRVLHALLSPFSPGKYKASNSSQLIRLDLITVKRMSV
jgi:hypothetical protein